MTHANDIDHDEDAAGFDGVHGRHFQRCAKAIKSRSMKYIGVGPAFDG